MTTTGPSFLIVLQMWSKASRTYIPSTLFIGTTLCYIKTYRKLTRPRDLHEGNVLVRQYFPIFDPKQVEFPQTVIADLGEAFSTSQDDESRQIYYGNADFWAPEVKHYHKYSPASDVYALGCLIKVMV